MGREEVYKSLEDSMLTYAELKQIEVIENGEPLVPLSRTDNLSISPNDPEMQLITGEEIYVREAVAACLGAAALSLSEERPELRLEVVYGYRSLEIQKRNFKRQLKTLADKYQGSALVEAAHRRVAVPEVAGHPTGGAVDVQIIQGCSPLDFGTRQREFVRDSYAGSPYIGPDAKGNRQLLTAIMMSAGFAPYEGEWWHFSYGDREWAAYYKEPNAVYQQLPWVAP